MRRGDMTQGSIWKRLIIFAIPLLLGNLLQQLYNAFDAIVVGNFVSQEALAAVGSTGPLINMIIAFFMGMSTGASVLISQAFGARDQKLLHDTVHTAITLSLIMGVVLSIVGIAISPMMLQWMNTPKEILGEATEYLQIYFAGLTALTVYNMGTAILTATGDSRRPLYFLAVSTVVNIVGNLVFVNVFHWGIAGVAWSTVIAQALCAGLVVFVLCRSQTDFKVILRHLRIHVSVLKRIVNVGLPGGIQQAIISLSNIFVQAYFNGLGPVMLAGYSASNKLDAFIMLPVQTMGMAVTTFVGQNLGAHQVKRARQGTRVSFLISLIATIPLSILALLFGRTMLRIFTPDPTVLEYGYQFMTVFAPAYVIFCVTQILSGALRGGGDVRVPTLVSIISYVALRQIYLYFVTKIEYSLFTVAFSYPVTWFIAAIGIGIYFAYAQKKWDRYALPDAPESTLHPPEDPDEKDSSVAKADGRAGDKPIG